MGFYIQTPEINHNKSLVISDKYRGKIVPKPKYEDLKDDEVIVVCVSNGIFEAAAIAYDESEFDAFNDPSDIRPKEYVILSKTNALEAYGDQDNADRLKELLGQKTK